MAGMAGVVHAKRRQRASIEQLPSGSFRVCVYTGVDPLTGPRSSPQGDGRYPCGGRTSPDRMQAQVDKCRSPAPARRPASCWTGAWR
jgi:hypothetical protein